MSPLLRSTRTGPLVLGALTLALAHGQVGAAVIVDGLYQLHNHPDGAEVPPPYGMRLDELVDVTGGLDVFTLDFDAPGSNMQMTITGGGSIINIFGQAVGGRDIGGAYAADAFFGLYTVNFTYNVGVGPAPGDDDIQVNGGTGANFGVLGTPFGPPMPLHDVVGNPPGFSFRLGDEDNDLGHRGYNGISGWGWIDPDGFNHGPTRDFLFTAELVPAPGAVALFAPALMMYSRRRRA